ncbi:hypothetical protein ACVWXM_001430 [Bradyrhizobium sp. GM7.3]
MQRPVLFGNFNKPMKSHPYGVGYRIIHMNGMAAISIDEVLDAATRLLSASPIEHASQMSPIVAR